MHKIVHTHTYTHTHQLWDIEMKYAATYKNVRLYRVNAKKIQSATAPLNCDSCRRMQQQLQILFSLELFNLTSSASCLLAAKFRFPLQHNFSFSFAAASS